MKILMPVSTASCRNCGSNPISLSKSYASFRFHETMDRLTRLCAERFHEHQDNGNDQAVQTGGLGNRLT